MTTQKEFSIVVPVGPNFIDKDKFAESLLGIEFNVQSFEVIIVVDSEQPQVSANLLHDELSKANLDVSLYHNAGPLGPGIARNIGVANAKHPYILFIDCDDRINSRILAHLNDEKTNSDLIFFNFSRQNRSNEKTQTSRKDIDFFENKELLIEGALKNQIEQECWQAAYKREFLVRNSIEFNEGFFEDIRFNLACLIKMNSYVFINEILYEKLTTPKSITSELSVQSISNQIASWLQMADLALSELGKEFEDYLRIGFQNLIGQFATKIIAENLPEDVMSTLIQHLVMEVNKLKIISNVSTARNSHPTLYGDIFKLLTSTPMDVSGIAKFVEKRKKMEWSCGDIENSVFLAPNEIRTCCKRFFVDGQISGDVVLNIKIEERADQLEKVESRQILEAKNSLKRRINIGNRNECTGCPYLELKDWKIDKPTFEIKYLSMEQHSICNLRCTYCDDKYYGGLRPNYDVKATLLDLHKNGVTSNLKTVVWGGGEPTLDPNFPEMLRGVSEVAPRCEHRFLSNSKRFSKEIYNALSEGHSQLVTSMDAGSESKYLEIRGRKGYLQVLENLKKYSELANNSLVIKYIFTSENREFSELEKFVEDIVRFQLSGNIFQISYDFKSEVIDRQGSEACLYLFALLYNVDARYIYFDDLLLARLQTSSFTDIKKVIEGIGPSTKRNCFGQPGDYDDITLFGAGDQADRLERKFNLLGRYPITSIVEDQLSGSGKTFHGIEVGNLDTLTSSASRILLAGVQGIPQMLKRLSELGIENKRIIREILI